MKPALRTPAALALSSLLTLAGAAGCGPRIHVESANGLALTPLPGYASVEYLPEAPGENYEVVCSIRVTVEGGGDDPDSYRPQLEEAARKCGAPAVFANSISSIGNSYTLLASGIRITSDPPVLGEKATMKKLSRAMAVDDVETTRAILQPVDPDPDKRAEIDNLALTGFYAAYVERGAPCVPEMVELLEGDYGVRFAWIERPLIKSGREIPFCGAEVARGFAATDDQLAFAEKLRKELTGFYFADVEDVQHALAAVTPVVATMKSACERDPSHDLCLVGKSYTRIGTKFAESLAEQSDDESEFNSAKRELAEKLMSIVPGGQTMPTAEAEPAPTE